MLSLAFLGSGCHHYIVRQDLPSMPSSAEVQQLTTRWANANLKDPESARLQDFSEPKPGYGRGAFMTAGLPGWVWSVSINAKNSFGGYVGFQNYWLLYAKNGKVRGAQGTWDMEPSSFLSDVGTFVIAKGVMEQ